MDGGVLREICCDFLGVYRIALWHDSWFGGGEGCCLGPHELFPVYAARGGPYSLATIPNIGDKTDAQFSAKDDQCNPVSWI